MIKYFLICITILFLFTGCDKIVTNGNKTDTNGYIFNTNSFSDYTPWWVFNKKTNEVVVTNKVAVTNVASTSTWTRVTN